MPEELKPVQTVFTENDLDVMECLVALGLCYRAELRGDNDNPIFALGALFSNASLDKRTPQEIDSFLDKSKALMKARRLRRDGHKGG